MPLRKSILPTFLFVLGLQGSAVAQARKPAHPLLGHGRGVDHVDGSIIALSIEVSELNKARSWVEGRSGQKLEPYKGFNSQSILIPPDLTHGVWMELFQR